MLFGWKKSSVVFIAIVSLILMSYLPLIQGFTSNVIHSDAMNESSYEVYDIYMRKQYDPSELTTFGYHEKKEQQVFVDSYVETNTMSEILDNGCNDLMDSVWPMYCHDTRHTGRSPYSTVNATGVVKWRTATVGGLGGGPAIDNNGTIYIGSSDLNAVYPNGTLKWRFPVGIIMCNPAIAEDGTIYFGVDYGSTSLYALNPNGTVKWTYPTGGSIDSSPVIGDDGTIYVGSESNTIHAIYPNGTRKWVFNTDHVVLSSPAIGPDGIIYCGCHDTYLYALYSENGTLKWKYKTGDWIRVSPCIADDGTIYIISFDCNLHAVNPNGTMKWKTYLGQAGTSPTIGLDGTIYCGYHNLYAINPENGSIKWIYDVPGTIEGGTPCSSIDGTIYLGTWEGGYLIAVNPDGTERWRKSIGNTDSPPAIGADGTIYIGSEASVESGWLYAFGKGPLSAEANGPYNGYAHSLVQFSGNIYGGVLPYNYLWDFSDGTTSKDQNPKHTYDHSGNYKVTFIVTDAEDNSSSDIALVVVDYALPTVSILKPTNALYIANIKLLPLKFPIIIGGITVSIDATQEDGFEITQLKIYIDDCLKATLTSEPYTWIWKGIAFNGYLDHDINICAYDSKGRTNWTSLYVWKFI